MTGNIIVIACVLILAFFSGRSTVRMIRAELRGECTCADCGGCGKSGAECCECMQRMEELRKLRENKKCLDQQRER